MVLRQFNEYQDYKRQRSNLQESIRYHERSPAFGAPPAPALPGNPFKEGFQPNFAQKGLKVIDRTSKFGAAPVERPMQAGEFERMKMMFEMYQRPPVAPWHFSQQAWRGAPKSPYGPGPGVGPGFAMPQTQNFFAGNRDPRGHMAPFGGEGARTFGDDAGIENSEAETRVSELERMIDMIEKANTQISSLISQSHLDILTFQKKVSMCSATDGSARRGGGRERITRSADPTANVRRIQELKTKFEALTKKTISRLNEVLPDEGSALESANQAGYLYARGRGDRAEQLLELQRKLDELQRKRRAQLEEVRKGYQEKCEHMERDFRALFEKVGAKKKELARRVRDLERERAENVLRIKGLLEAKKQKEVMLAHISKTLLLSKKEVEGIGERAQQKEDEEAKRANREREEKQRLERRIADLEREKQEAREQAEAAQTEASHEQERVTAALEAARARAEGAEKERAALERKVAESLEEAARRREELKAKQIVLEDRAQEAEALRRELRAAQEESRTEAEKETRRLERENTRLKGRTAELEKKTEKLRKKNARQDDLIEEYEAELSGKNEMVLGLNHQLDEAKREAARSSEALREEAAALRKCLAEMEDAVAESVNVG